MVFVRGRTVERRWESERRSLMRCSSSVREEGEEKFFVSSLTEKEERILRRVLGEADWVNLRVWGGRGAGGGFEKAIGER